MPKKTNSTQENPTNNAWINGSFYLTSTLSLLVVLAVISYRLPAYVLPIVIVAGILLVAIIGAFQLRNDAQLSEKSFLSLMIETFKRLPLLRRIK